MAWLEKGDLVAVGGLCPGMGNAFVVAGQGIVNTVSSALTVVTAPITVPVVAARGGAAGVKTLGQKMKLNNAGTCHFGIAINNREMAHATGSGTIQSPLDINNPAIRSHISIYRLKDNFKAIADEAAEVALRWSFAAPPEMLGEESDFSTRKAARAVFRFSYFGTSGKTKANAYHANRAGRFMPGKKHDRKEWFCSMFAIACYQAVQGSPRCAAYMALDASHTSPQVLEGYLKGSPAWEKVGLAETTRRRGAAVV